MVEVSCLWSWNTNLQPSHTQVVYVDTSLAKLVVCRHNLITIIVDIWIVNTQHQKKTLGSNQKGCGSKLTSAVLIDCKALENSKN